MELIQAGVSPGPVLRLIGPDELLVKGLNRVYSDRQLVVLRTDSPAGLRFTGEIDASNAHAVAHSLDTALTSNGDVHLDLSQLLFCDISGIRAIVSAAETVTDGRRLLLHGLPSQLESVMKLVGWGDLPGLVMCSCGAETR
jgi:anti-anti-sigma factor